MQIIIDVPDGVSGDWCVETFEVRDNELSQKISLWKTGRYVPSGTYKRLMHHGTVVMSNTPDEIRDLSFFIIRAKGNILINGLGLGVMLKALLDKPEVISIAVIEISSDVINLVAPTYIGDKRLTIINADAFEWKPPKCMIYDYVWHDIWDYLCKDNLIQMAKLHRKYGKKAKYQDSWGKAFCKRIRT